MSLTVFYSYPLNRFVGVLFDDFMKRCGNSRVWPSIKNKYAIFKLNECQIVV